jgi:hypothetical protein
VVARWNASIVAFSPLEFDRNILMLGVAGFFEATAKLRQLFLLMRQGQQREGNFGQ